MADDNGGAGWASPGYTPPPGYGAATPAYTPWGSAPGTPPVTGTPPAAGPGDGWTPQPVTTVKPGIVPLRPLALGEVLDGAISLIRAHPRVTLGLSAGVAVVQQVLGLVLTLSLIGTGGFSTGFDESSGDTPFAAFPEFFTVGGVAVQLVNAVLTVILTGLLTLVTADAVLGRTPTMAGVWARLRPLLWPLVVAGTLAGVLPFLGLVLLVIPGVFLWGALMFATPALVLERLRPVAALKRSWRLAVPDWWRVFFIRLLAVIISAFIAGVLVLPATLGSALLVGFAGGSDGAATGVLIAVSAIAGVLATTVTAPFTAGVVALLYLDRRMRAEGLDVTLQETVARDAAAAGEGTGGTRA